MEDFDLIAPEAQLSPGTRTVFNADVLENRFGRYSQRTPDEDNHNYKEIRVIWENIHTNRYYQIIAFLEPKQKWEIFLWTAPKENTQKRWTCQDMEATHFSGNNNIIEATFRQEFSGN